MVVLATVTVFAATKWYLIARLWTSRNLGQVHNIDNFSVSMDVYTWHWHWSQSCCKQDPELKSRSYLYIVQFMLGHGSESESEYGVRLKFIAIYCMIIFHVLKKTSKCQIATTFLDSGCKRTQSMLGKADRSWPVISPENCLFYTRHVGIWMKALFTRYMNM